MKQIRYISLTYLPKRKFITIIIYLFSNITPISNNFIIITTYLTSDEARLDGVGGGGVHGLGCVAVDELLAHLLRKHQLHLNQKKSVGVVRIN